MWRFCCGTEWQTMTISIVLKLFLHFSRDVSKIRRLIAGFDFLNSFLVYVFVARIYFLHLNCHFTIFYSRFCFWFVNRRHGLYHYAWIISFSRQFRSSFQPLLFHIFPFQPSKHWTHLIVHSILRQLHDSMQFLLNLWQSSVLLWIVFCALWLFLCNFIQLNSCC